MTEGAAGGERDLGFEVVGVKLEDGGARRIERGSRGGGRGDEEERRDERGGFGGGEAAAPTAHEPSGLSDGKGGHGGGEAAAAVA